MKDLKQITETINKAKLQDTLNRAVVAGDKAGIKAAIRQLAAAVGEEKANTMAEIAQRAVDEKNSVAESALRMRDINESIKRVEAEDQLVVEAEKAGVVLGLLESMKFGIGDKQPLTKAKYPKTNKKRIADEWNERVGNWYQAQKDAGHQMLVRNSDEPFVVDAIDDEGVYETMVVKGRNSNKHDQFTIDFLNQRHGGENEYSGHAEHHGTFKFTPVKLENSASSDQRNVPTTKSDSRAQRGRKKDGESLRDLMKTPKSKK